MGELCSFKTTSMKWCYQMSGCLVCLRTPDSPSLTIKSSKWADVDGELISSQIDLLKNSQQAQSCVLIWTRHSSPLDFKCVILVSVKPHFTLPPYCRVFLIPDTTWSDVVSKKNSLLLLGLVWTSPGFLWRGDCFIWFLYNRQKNGEKKDGLPCRLTWDIKKSSGACGCVNFYIYLLF